MSRRGAFFGWIHGFVFAKPASDPCREIKNPTAFVGPWVLWVIEKSAPQNCHGSEASDDLGYDVNFDGYELIHV